MDTKIIKIFRETLPRMENENNQDVIILWNEYLDIWESWVNYVNHTNNILSKFGCFDVLLFPWFIYRTTKSETILKQLDKKMKEINNNQVINDQL